MSILNIDFDEARQSQLPFVELLLNLGYKYISREELLQERKGDTGKFILRKTASEVLMKINSYEYAGKEYKFSEEKVFEAIDELENIPYEGLVDTSAKIYQTIMPTSGGKTIQVFHDGKKMSQNFRFIDFENVENNVFQVAVEFEATGKENIRPDIVVFINGIPLAIIENKKASVDVQEALRQMIRNQRAEYCPRLFIYPQLLVATNGKDLRYGTTATPTEFYAKWREKDGEKELEEKVENLISTKIEKDLYKKVCLDLNGATKNHLQKINRDVTEQDRGVVAIFDKHRILDLAKNFILYDAGIKKVMRYQQYFAIKRILERIEHRVPGKDGDKREGGILWHTQGSGKSLTMVMFIKALIESPEIINPRVLIVTDRKDLDRQIKGTFENAGLKKEVVQAKSGEDLLNLIEKKDLSVVTTLIQKFQSASRKNVGFEDLDDNIFVLIDEAHRSQGGEANIEMNRIIPNACYIAFTGTPLLKKEKSKNKFGSFIDKYTIDDALTDEIILPLIYEGRYVDLHQDKKEVDRQWDRVTDGLPDAHKYQLQQDIEKKIIANNPSRIAEISYDIEKHYITRFKDTGLKAQIVAPSKYSAVLFEKYFKESGKVQTALVISDENGLIDMKDSHKRDVDEYLKDIKEKYQSLKKYEESVIDSFKYNEDGVEILIVVDKLLTGFDAPRNTVLYLAKELRDHNLLQAIARVNRLFDNRNLPKTAGYIIDYSENAQNIRTAMQLFGNYDGDDVAGALIDVREKINELDDHYGKLHDIFRGVKDDDEAYLKYLEDEQIRKEFYDGIRKFLTTFNECMNLRDFVHEFENIDIYRKELKKFMELRKIASVRYAERVDFAKYKQALTKIMDENIRAEEVEFLTREITITDKDAFEKVIEELGSDKSKADAITAQTKKIISENAVKDPEFYNRFSKQINDLIEEMRLGKIADIEALKEARKINEEVNDKKDETVPLELSDKAGADIIFRNIKKEFDDLNVTEDQYVEIISNLHGVICDNAVVDWWKNSEHKRRMKEVIDDYLYDEVKIKMDIELTNEKIEEMIDIVMDLVQNNHEIFSL